MSLISVKELGQLPVKIVSVHGNSEERGYQYGCQARELICKSLEINKRLVLSLRPDTLTWRDILDEVHGFIPAIKRYDRKLLIEMNAIASGAEVTLEEIVFLNLRSELMNPAFAKTLITEGCTTIFLERGRTEGNKALIGQTYDWFPECREILLLLHSEDENGHEFITVTEAGIIGKVGCNNYGVASMLNYLNNFEINRSGTPYSILLRRVLDSEGFYQAQRNIMRSPIAFGLNMTIGSRKGSGIDYELTAKGIDFFYPENGLLIHTNHYISEKLSVRTFNKRMYPSSKERYDTAKKLLLKDKIAIKDLMHVMAYHDMQNINNNICKHSETDEYGMETIFTIIIELTEMVLYFCTGTPCKSNFYKINLTEVFKSILED